MKKIIAIFTIFSIVLASCKKDVLDITPLDRVSENAVWADESLIKAYHNELYSAIPHGFYIHMYSKYTDEAYNLSLIHISEPTRLLSISYAVFCLKKKKK